MTEATITQNTLIGLFNDRIAAEGAIADLQAAGYQPADMSVVMRDSDQAGDMANSTGANVADGIAGGATTGGVVGALAGLLIGIGAITIPGIGAVLIGGPLAAALGLTGAAATTATGALTGAVAGGLVGGLVGLGVPEEEAQVYEDRLKEGAILLAVPSTATGGSGDARQILADHGATQIRLLNG